MLIVSFFHANLEKVTIEAVACVSGKIIGLTDIDLNFFVYCMKQETRFIFGPFIFEFRFADSCESYLRESCAFSGKESLVIIK